MGNPLFNMFGGNGMPQGNNIITAFNQFKSSLQGDPKAMVQQLLNSGKMTQDQFNQLQSMASQLKGILK